MFIGKINSYLFLKSWFKKKKLNKSKIVIFNAHEIKNNNV